MRKSSVFLGNLGLMKYYLLVVCSKVCLFFVYSETNIAEIRSQFDEQRCCMFPYLQMIEF